MRLAEAFGGFMIASKRKQAFSELLVYVPVRIGGIPGLQQIQPDRISFACPAATKQGSASVWREEEL